MTALIKNDGQISNTINNMGLYRALRGRVNGLGYSPDEQLMPYLELAGFGSTTLIRMFDLRYDLISALVERWHPETHTFHLLCGECAVTLEDVALQLGLPIAGSAVTGVNVIAELAAVCYSLLGVLHADAESNFTSLKFSWLKNVSSYSWGFAVLAMLYRELCQTTKPDAIDIGRCLLLLQLWDLYQMPFLASFRHQPYVFPLVHKWSYYPGIGRSYTVPIYCLMIEQHVEEGFIWMPYRRPEIAVGIPSSPHIHSHLWCTNAPIINFQTVEWYNGDRVLWQFGCIQYIPDPPMQVGKIHLINKRGKHGNNWGLCTENILHVG
ncbi:hypothetical protein PVK06_026853 [Gossypium arboreum]|uniref:Aminotransferase-like plant mobile domain-containing protein n=1 Tax=Gossypium arboreum TaxID=29729 RepID=A0ABR0NYU1_GOSAR|nr:hypothetical protein PVK06_026853 [Gossypium arboreum]